jgi:hypothetical protein
MALPSGFSGSTGLLSGIGLVFAIGFLFWWLAQTRKREGSIETAEAVGGLFAKKMESEAREAAVTELRIAEEASKEAESAATFSQAARTLRLALQQAGLTTPVYQTLRDGIARIRALIQQGEQHARLANEQTIKIRQDFAATRTQNKVWLTTLQNLLTEALRRKAAREADIIEKAIAHANTYESRLVPLYEAFFTAFENLEKAERELRQATTNDSNAFVLAVNQRDATSAIGKLANLESYLATAEPRAAQAAEQFKARGNALNPEIVKWNEELEGHRTAVQSAAERLKSERVE